jgi:predicted naringenin-chalcone synthase
MALVKPAILSLATALPLYSATQETTANTLAAVLRHPIEAAQKMVKIFCKSAIEKRHSVLPEIGHPQLRGRLFGEHFPDVVPTTAQRNEIYKTEAPKLAREVAEQALNQWGGDRSEITHVISVSCTGMIAPGIEFILIDELGLSRTVDRLGINFMGCFGAFRGLAMARALAQQDPSHRVLLVCTELCSLHFQTDMSPETYVANALFADGAGAVIVGQPKEGESVLWEIEQTGQYALEDSQQEMTWEAGDTGYLMRLTLEVPKRIRDNISQFAARLLGGSEGFSTCSWAVHPGGKAVLHAVTQACQLTRTHLESSWEVLRRCGNMSSATFLFILDELIKNGKRSGKTIGLGFGPGLSMEGIVLSA